MRFISHELRTPLNSVFMGLQLSIDQIPEDTQEPVEVERKETLVEIQSACGAALDILNELLLFDKLETGALVLNKLRVPVPELVEDSILMFSVQTREKNIELIITNNDETMYSPTAPLPTTLASPYLISIPSLHLYDTDEVTVDKNKVVQVIRNVVSNAIKFTPARGRIQINVKFVPGAQYTKKDYSGKAQTIRRNKSQVYPTDGDRVGGDSDVEKSMSVRSQLSDRLGLASSSLKQVSGELVVEIKDNGAGISEVNQRRLFTEVVQFNPELLQNGGGSGLGMCISKSIMDMHGGAISVYSAGEGQGSHFTVRLPMVRVVSNAGIPRTYTPTLPTRKMSLRPPPPKRTPSIKFLDQLPGSAAGTEGSRGPLYSSESPSPLIFASSASVKSCCSSLPEHPLRFLVVDDSSLNRKMMCRLLRNQGHECVEAGDGVQAVAVMTAALVDKRNAKDDNNEYETKVSEMECGELGSVADNDSGMFDMILMDFM